MQSRDRECTCDVAWWRVRGTIVAKRHFAFFPHCLINGTIFGETQFTELKICVFIFYTTLSGKLLVTRRVQRDVNTNLHSLHVQNPHFFSDFNQINFLDRFSKNPQRSHFIKIRPV